MVRPERERSRGGAVAWTLRMRCGSTHASRSLAERSGAERAFAFTRGWLDPSMAPASDDRLAERVSSAKAVPLPAIDAWATRSVAGEVGRFGGMRTTRSMLRVARPQSRSAPPPRARAGRSRSCVPVCARATASASTQSSSSLPRNPCFRAPRVLARCALRHPIVTILPARAMRRTLRLDVSPSSSHARHRA